MKTDKVKIDKIFQEGLSNESVPFDEAAWENMAGRLDAQMPESLPIAKPFSSFLKLGLFGGILLVIVGALYFFNSDNGIREEAQVNPVEQSIAQESEDALTDNQKTASDKTANAHAGVAVVSKEISNAASSTSAGAAESSHSAWKGESSNGTEADNGTANSIASKANTRTGTKATNRASYSRSGNSSGHSRRHTTRSASSGQGATASQSSVITNRTSDGKATAGASVSDNKAQQERSYLAPVPLDKPELISFAFNPEIPEFLNTSRKGKSSRSPLSLPAWDIGVKAGIHQLRKLSDGRLRNSYLAGVYGQYNLTPKLDLQAELLYSSYWKPLQADASEVIYAGGITYKYENIYIHFENYLDLPILLRYNVFRNAYVYGGGRLSYLLSTDYTHIVGYSRIDVEAESNVEVFNGYAGRYHPYNKGILKADAAITFGAQYQIGRRFLADVRGNIGLFDISKNDYAPDYADTHYHSSLDITLGYRIF